MAGAKAALRIRMTTITVPRIASRCRRNRARAGDSLRPRAPPGAASTRIAAPNASFISPRRGSRISSEADTRVHDGVEEIRREIPQDHEDPGEDQDAHRSEEHTSELQSPMY